MSQSHAAKRARERYNVDLSNADLRAICDQIKRGENATIERVMRDGLQRIVVLFQGRALFVLYNPIRNWIVTIYPHGWHADLRESSRKELHQRERRRR